MNSLENMNNEVKEEKNFRSLYYFRSKVLHEGKLEKKRRKKILFMNIR